MSKTKMTDNKKRATDLLRQAWAACSGNTTVFAEAFYDFEHALFHDEFDGKDLIVDEEYEPVGVRVRIEDFNNDELTSVVNVMEAKDGKLLQDTWKGLTEVKERDILPFELLWLVADAPVGWKEKE